MSDKSQVPCGCQEGGKYQRSAVFIDRRFQTRYLLLIAGTALLIMVVLGVMYAGVLADQRELLGINAIAGDTVVSGDDAALDAALSSSFRSEDDLRLAALFVSAAILVGLLSWVAVRMTFRVVGPIRAASNMLRGIRCGDDSSIRHFRKGDEFMFLSRDIIDLRDSIREREALMKRMLDQARLEIERAGGDPAIAAEIGRFLSSDEGRFADKNRED
jgi:hypothetical protein